MTVRESADKAAQKRPRQVVVPWARRLLLASGGHTSIEYAVVLTLLICAVVSAALLLGTNQRRTFGQVSQEVTQTNVEGKRPARAPTRSEEVEAAPSRAWLVPIAFILLSLGLWSIARLLAHRSTVNTAPSQTPVGNERTQARYVEQRQRILRAVRNNLNKLQVRHIMTDHVATAGASATLEELAQLMKDQGVWQVIICDASRKPLGIVSHRFLRAARGRKARDIMSSNPIIVAPEMDLRIAITLLLEQNLTCVPVVCDGVLQGMVTNTELAMGLQVLMQVLQQLPSGELAPM